MLTNRPARRRRGPRPRKDTLGLYGRTLSALGRLVIELRILEVGSDLVGRIVLTLVRGAVALLTTRALLIRWGSRRGFLGFELCNLFLGLLDVLL